MDQAQADAAAKHTQLMNDMDKAASAPSERGYYWFRCERLNLATKQKEENGWSMVHVAFYDYRRKKQWVIRHDIHGTEPLLPMLKRLDDAGLKWEFQGPLYPEFRLPLTQALTTPIT